MGACSTKHSPPAQTDGVILTAADEPEAGAWTVDAWLSSLPLHKHIAAALAPPAGTTSAFEYAKGTLAGELEERLEKAGLEGLLAPIRAAIEEIAQMEAS